LGAARVVRSGLREGKGASELRDVISLKRIKERDVKLEADSEA